MLLNFNLENIKYMKIEYSINNNSYVHKLALKEKKENIIIAVMPKAETSELVAPYTVEISFICNDGLYKTNTTVESIYTDDEYTFFEIQNPKTLDYQQNRAYYRVLADFDCIYTIETDDGQESFNATTYDISTGGVSIITSENIIPTRETSIIIYTPECSIKSYLKFVRCEAFEDAYKLAFNFMDLEEKYLEYLTKLCVNKQCDSF
jgi:c-di-GMP-binding flagellar brake protein YcgR